MGWDGSEFGKGCGDFALPSLFWRLYSAATTVGSTGQIEIRPITIWSSMSANEVGGSRPSIMMRETRTIMGMAVTIAIPGALAKRQDIDAVFEQFVDC